MTEGIEVRSRGYAGESDLRLLENFLVASMVARPPHTYWHLGNLLWSMFFSLQYDPCRDVRIWEDEQGRVLGFAWFDAPNAVDLQIAPRLRGTGLLETPMLAWAAEHARAFEQSGEPRLWTSALGGDAEYTRYLTEHGFERAAPSMVRMLRELDAGIPRGELPAGWTVRPVGDEDEWSERVAAHREVWHPSRVTVEAYRRLRAAPGYLPTLDFAAVAPDGAIASYCICWLDPGNRVGLFEPVGTRPAYRRRGLSRAVLQEALQRLVAYGARMAFVSTNVQNDPAIKLYRAVGFRIVETEFRYSKRF